MKVSLRLRGMWDINIASITDWLCDAEKDDRGRRVEGGPAPTRSHWQAQASGSDSDSESESRAERGARG